MLRYKINKPGFHLGRLYDPNGKRPILYTSKPFPKKKGKNGKQEEQVPSWMTRMPDENQTETQLRETAEEEAARLEKERKEADDREVTSFMTPDVGPTGVTETL